MKKQSKFQRKNKARNKHAGKRIVKSSQPQRKNKQKMETMQTSVTAKPWIATSSKKRAMANSPASVRDISSFKKKDDRDDILAAQKIEAGDKNSFIQIWDRYHPWFVQRAFHMVKDHDEAEDIAIAVLSKAYEKIIAGAYRPSYTFNAWINFMFKNYMVDYSRKNDWKNKGLTVSLDNVISDSEGSETSFSETMTDQEGMNSSPAFASSDSLILMNEQKRAVREALATLDDVGQQLIGLFYGKQLSYDEIVEELNMNEGTVKALMFRAKQKVKSFIIHRYPELVKKDSPAWKQKNFSSESNMTGDDFEILFAA